MSGDFDRFEIGYQLSESNITPELMPIIDETVKSYERHHDNLTSVYIIGSAALGEWRRGISDLDVIGLSRIDISVEEDQARRDDLVRIAGDWDAVTFIDNTAISVLDMEESGRRTPAIDGHLAKLALSGVRVWGDQVDFSEHVPSLQDMTYGRTRRAEALMQKYRSGNLIEPFRNDPRLLTRSCAKAAMRVLSSMAILRGAAYHSSPYRTSEELECFVPEAAEINKRAIEIINDPAVVPEVAMEVTDQAVRLFYRLFPGDIPDTPTS